MKVKHIPLVSYIYKPHAEITDCRLQIVRLVSQAILHHNKISDILQIRSVSSKLPAKKDEIKTLSVFASFT